MIQLICFTQGGHRLAKRIAAILPEQTDIVMRGDKQQPPALSLTECAQKAMQESEAVVFIGAAGIAVRAIAPYVQSKACDPAVLVLDEAGKFVIPLLSGHLGGANALAERIAKEIGAQPVLTTATDVRGLFAVDSWAKTHGFCIAEIPHIRYISGALLRGESVGIVSAFPIQTPLPDGVVQTENAENGFLIAYHTQQNPFLHTLHLIPQCVTVGIGCRKGIPFETIDMVLQQALQQAQIDIRAVCQIASIDIKKEEVGLLVLAEKLHLPFLTYPAQVLQDAKGDFRASKFVQRQVGVDNVCERAAVCASNGDILFHKFAKDGVTVAFAAKTPEVVF